MTTAAIATPLVATSFWLAALRRYVLFAAVANLVWETAHVPLYTIWRDGTAGEIAFAIIHCMGGDILIAVAMLVLALLVAGHENWPQQSAWPVARLTILFGVTSAILIEWLNIVVRKSWAYSDLMPVIPILDAGLSPVMQWIAVPLAALWWACLPAVAAHKPMEIRV